MMQDEILRRARSTSRSSPPRRPAGLLHRWGCVTYEVNDEAVEVIVPDAPAERQGGRELLRGVKTRVGVAGNSDLQAERDFWHPVGCPILCLHAAKRSICRAGPSFGTPHA